MDSSKVFQFYYVFDSCEPNYQYSTLVAELWGLISSFSFFLIPIIGMSSRSDKIRRCNKSLLLVGICSSLHHLLLNHVTQFFDELSIIIAEIIFLDAIDVKLDKWTIALIASFIPFGILHPLPLGVIIFTLFWIIIKNAITIAKQHRNQLGMATKIIVIVNFLAVTLCLSDFFMCAYPHFKHFHFHSWWHVLMACFCYLGEECIGILEKLKLKL